ncbi:hypothetical protein EZBTHKR_2311 [Elizabethkingia anophelis]|nr:hypothetical protein EZBTHKR_2311 [Elizabethkingia anophelis]
MDFGPIASGFSEQIKTDHGFSFVILLDNIYFVLPGLYYGL